MNFDTLPTVQEWRSKQGDPPLADRYFTEIERLLGLCTSADGVPEDLFDLYLLTDFYMKDSHRKHGAGVSDPALEVVRALHVHVGSELDRSLADVAGATLREKILDLLGKGVHQLYDQAAERHLYVTGEREQRMNKLCFRRGLAYRWTGERAGLFGWGEKKLLLFDGDTLGMTSHSGLGWAIYVLGPRGRIYVNKHLPDHFYHSCLLAGASTFSAGEIRVTKGLVEDITCHSGHYKPGSRQMLNMVNRLHQYGVDLQTLKVWTFVMLNDRPKLIQDTVPLFRVCSGTEFLTTRGVEPAEGVWRRAMAGSPSASRAENPGLFA